MATLCAVAWQEQPRRAAHLRACLDAFENNSDGQVGVCLRWVAPLHRKNTGLLTLEIVSNPARAFHAEVRCRCHDVLNDSAQHRVAVARLRLGGLGSVEMVASRRMERGMTKPCTSVFMFRVDMLKEDVYQKLERHCVEAQHAECPPSSVQLGAQDVATTHLHLCVVRHSSCVRERE